MISQLEQTPSSCVQKGRLAMDNGGELHSSRKIVLLP